MIKLFICIAIYIIIALLLIATVKVGAGMIMKKSKEGDLVRLTLLLICTLLIGAPFFLMFRGLYCLSNIPVGDYEKDIQYPFTYIEDSKIKIASNIYGEPIFKNPVKAFKQIRKMLPELCDEIEDEYGITLSITTYSDFDKVYYWHNYKDPEAAKQVHTMHEFLEIYENSLKRLEYIIPEGWIRDKNMMGLP